jgi:hypothetical protein
MHPPLTPVLWTLVKHHFRLVLLLPEVVGLLRPVPTVTVVLLLLLNVPPTLLTRFLDVLLVSKVKKVLVEQPVPLALLVSNKLL